MTISKRSTKIAVTLVTVALGLLFSVSVHAQVATGTISGMVKDPAGNVIPGTKIVILNEGTGISRTVTTDASGLYVVPSLNPENYQVTATHEGFRTEVRTGIVLTVGSNAVVDMTLAVGAVAQTVTVTGNAPLVDTTDAALGSLMDETSMRALPLNGRSYSQLALMQPGVILTSPGVISGQMQTYGTGSRFSVGGQHPTANLFLLDGTNINDQGNGTPGGAAGTNLGVDTIQEFKIFTNSFEAEYGHSSGSVISSVTRSGTNTLHGTAFEYIRNNVLDTRNFFDVGATPPFRRNQFGGVLGGPIKKDKTFFFAGYEGLRQGLATTLIATVPDALARQGILPVSVGSTTTMTVPVNPVMTTYIDMYPLPNGRDFGNGTAEYNSAPLVPTNEDYFMVRVDHQLDSKTGIFGRYSFDNDSVNAQQSIPVDFVDQKARRQYATLQANSVLSAKSLNNIRFAFNRSNAYYDPFVSPDPGPTYDFVPNGPFGLLSIGGSLIPNGPTALTALGTVNGAGPFLYVFNTIETADDYSHIIKNHSLKFGVDIQRVQYNNETTGQLLGAYNFSSYTNFLAGTASGLTISVPVGFPPYFGLRQTLYAAYAQDDYTVNRRLTLNLGLRWEITTDPTAVNVKMSIVPSPSATATVPSNNFFSTTKKNLEPRFGLAWRLNDSGKTVLRVGGGIYHNQVLPWLYQSFDNVPPYDGKDTITNPPFPHGYMLATAPLTAAGNGTAALQVMAPVIKTPVDDQYNVSIQQQILKNTVIMVAYAGNHGNHMPIQWEADTRINMGTAAVPYYPVGDAKMNTAWADMRVLGTAANSLYNSGTVSLRQQVAGGFVGQVSYVYAKSTDVNSSVTGSESGRDPAVVMNPYDFAEDYGLSEFNVKSAVVGNFAYPLPWRVQSKVLGAIIDGWGLDGVATFETGLPFSALNSSDTSNDNDSQNAERPNLRPGFSNNPTHGKSAGCNGFVAGTSVHNAANWYDPCAFSAPAAGYYGDLGRNTIIGPGFDDVDAALEKSFKVREIASVTFRAEMFNVLNHTDLGLPNTQALASGGAANASAGVITYTTEDSREAQFALRISF